MSLFLRCFLLLLISLLPAMASAEDKFFNSNGVHMRQAVLQIRKTGSLFFYTGEYLKRHIIAIMELTRTVEPSK